MELFSWVIELFDAVVADLIRNENVASITTKPNEKQDDDSGLESGQSSIDNSKFDIKRFWMNFRLWQLWTPVLRSPTIVIRVKQRHLIS